MVVQKPQRYESSSNVYQVCNKRQKTVFHVVSSEFKITVSHGQFPTIITHFRELVNIFSPFSDYLIGHPLTLQAAATVM